MSRRAPAQLSLELRRDRRGGARRGAGRKPKRQGRPIIHARRSEVTRHDVVHVSVRAVPGVRRLRSAAGYRAIRQAMLVCVGRPDFRIVHASIQGNHLHLLVEADDQQALARGLRAFMISAARRLNRAASRRGPVFERYHMTIARTPRQTRHALAYVLNNWRRHREHLAGLRQRRTPIDPYSSGPRFDGWRTPPVRLGLPADYQPLPTQPPRTWLLNVGWRQRYPLIGVDEIPGPAPS